jgi:hypothetical protein
VDDTQLGTTARLSQVNFALFVKVLQQITRLVICDGRRKSHNPEADMGLESPWRCIPPCRWRHGVLALHFGQCIPNKDRSRCISVGVAQTYFIAAVCVNQNQGCGVPPQGPVRLRQICGDGIRKHLDSIDRDLRERDNNHVAARGVIQCFFQLALAVGRWLGYGGA